MFEYEAVHAEKESGSPVYVSGEEALFSRSAGQKLSQDTPGQASTIGQRFVLALISLGMLMGMTTLLTILATARRAPGWEVFPFLFVLTLFTAAVVTINVAFSRRVW
ncbi:MAG TPA: hypothetical protein VKR83_07980 [Ktedonobacteraceae bacterium]|nr:hypothetical protein [Ktedonobacteraceae bacterium]